LTPQKRNISITNIQHK
ncbi:hypothetical protein D046_1298B, partial [Vibrio parahaemolyticus V-223/04]